MTTATETYKGRVVLNRKGTMVGRVISTRRCQLTGCSGVRLIVRWPDGRITMPCIRGCVELPTGAFKIQ